MIEKVEAYSKNGKRITSMQLDDVIKSIEEDVCRLYRNKHVHRFNAFDAKGNIVRSMFGFKCYDVIYVTD